MPIRNCWTIDDQIYAGKIVSWVLDPVQTNRCLRTTLGMTTEQVAARDTTIALFARLGLLAGFIIDGLITPSTPIALPQHDRTAHTVIERNEVSPDSLRTLVVDLVCISPRWVNELRKGLCVSGRRRIGLRKIIRWSLLTDMVVRAVRGSGRVFVADIGGRRVAVGQRSRQIVMYDRCF